jgi:hypothetical protein
MMRRLDICLLALGLHGLTISAAAQEACVVGIAGQRACSA